MKLKLIYFSSLFLIASCCFWCEEDVCERNYSFESDYDLYPSKESYNLNDTFWITGDFPSEFYHSNDELIDFSELGLKLELFLGRIDTIPAIQDYNNFEIILVNGEASFTEYIGVSVYNIEPDITSDKFVLNIGISPKAIGLYKLTFTTSYNRANRFGPELDSGDPCDEYIDNFAVILNRGENNNFDLLKNAKSEDWQNISQYDFINEGGFCFYVE